MKKFSLKSIINLSRVALANTQRNTLRSMYSTISKRASSIINQFKKHGREAELPRSLYQPSNSNKMTNNELVTAIGDMSNYFLNTRYSSYSAWRKDYDKKKAEYRKLMNKKKVSDAEFDEYRSFMNDMYYMNKNSMDPSDLYHESQDIWKLSSRLNLNPYQFADNMEKWSTRLETLNEKLDRKEIDVISGDDLSLDMYSEAFSKVASWLEEED